MTREMGPRLLLKACSCAKSLGLYFQFSASAGFPIRKILHVWGYLPTLGEKMATFKGKWFGKYSLDESYGIVTNTIQMVNSFPAVRES